MQILPVAGGAGEVTLGGEEVDVDVDEHNFHPNRNYPWRNVSLNRTKCGEGLTCFFSLLFMFCSDIVFLFTLAAFVSSKLQLILECNLSHQ